MATSILQELEEIFSCGQYGRIDPFLQDEKWKLMSGKEKSLLARLCLLQVKELYKHDPKKAALLIELCAKISAPAAPLLLDIAKTYAEFGRNIPNMRKALEFTEKAIGGAPLYVEAWNYKIYVCASLGDLLADFSFFTQGIEAYKKCIDIGVKKGKNSEFVEWNIAHLFHHLFSLSEEPSDLSESLLHFENGAKRKDMPPPFWIEYGNLLIEFSTVTQNTYYVNKAAHIFWRAIGKDPEEGSAWFKLALCLTKLFEEQPEKKIYKQANKCFKRAAHFFPNDPTLWTGWAMLELVLGKRTKSVASLQLAVERFEKAEQEGGATVEVLTHQSEALLSWGVLKQDHNMLAEALGHAQKAVELDYRYMEGWLVWGKTLIELGSYFLDERYYFEAADKLTQALQLKDDPFLSWMRGVSYYQAHEITGDKEYLESALSDFYTADSTFTDVSFIFQLDWAKALIRSADVFEQPELAEKGVLLLKESLQYYASEVEDLTSFLEALYTYGSGLQILGEFMGDEKLFEEAHSVFQAVIKLDPDHVPALLGIAQSYVKLGEILCDPQFYAQGIGYFEHIAKHDMEDEYVFFEWGLALMHLGKLLQNENAEAAFELFAEAEQKLVYAASLGSGPSCYYLACLYAYQGQTALSMRWLEEAHYRGHLPTQEEMNHDEWLFSLHDLEEFSLFLKMIETEEES